MKKYEQIFLATFHVCDSQIINQSINQSINQYIDVQVQGVFVTIMLGGILL